MKTRLVDVTSCAGQPQWVTHATEASASLTKRTLRTMSRSLGLTSKRSAKRADRSQRAKVSKEMVGQSQRKVGWKAESSHTDSKEKPKSEVNANKWSSLMGRCQEFAWNIWTQCFGRDSTKRVLNLKTYSKASPMNMSSLTWRSGPGLWICVKAEGKVGAGDRDRLFSCISGGRSSGTLTIVSPERTSRREIRLCPSRRSSYRSFTWRWVWGWRNSKDQFMSHKKQPIPNSFCATVNFFWTLNFFLTCDCVI